jgi:DNA-binding NtrC family response regulator
LPKKFAWFKSEKVDVVIVDYWMAGMNGIATALELKRFQPSVPVVMLSALAPFGEFIWFGSDIWIRKGDAEPEHAV